jgi:hypothetical protein
MKPTALPASRLVHAGVFAAYICLSLVMTWPLAAHWQDRIIGGPHLLYDDVAINVWNMWWLRWAIEHLHNPFWTSMLYFPEGVQMYVQTLNSTSSLLTLPLNYMFGPIAAYNGALVLAVAMTGFGGYLLVHQFVRHKPIALLCGALLAAAPYITLRFDNGHLNLISIQWIPLFFVALVRLEQRGGWRMSMAAITLFMLIVLTDWHWAFIAGVATAVWYVVQLARSSNRPLLLRRYLLVAAGIALAMTPLLIGMLTTRLPATGNQDVPLWHAYMQGYSSDAFGLFFPSLYQPLWAEPVTEALARTSPGYGPNGWYIAAGHTLLGLAALGIRWSWRRHWHLLVVAGAAWLLSLGPVLRVAGYTTNIPMPYTIVQHLPVISTGRRPSHFAVVPIVLATIFAGIGLQRLVERYTRPQRAIILILVAALATFELWHPMWKAVPFVQQSVAQQLHDRSGAVADLPYERMESGRSLRNQLLHEQPTLGGFVARRPAYPTLDNPWIGQLTAMERWATPDIIALDGQALAAMQCYYQIRHVLIAKHETTPQQLLNVAALVAQLQGRVVQPNYDDPLQQWYELPLFADRCRPFVYLRDGWYERGIDSERTWRWAGAHTSFSVVNPDNQSKLVTIRLTAKTLNTTSIRDKMGLR